MAAKYSIDYFHQTGNVLHETGTVDADAVTGMSIVMSCAGSLAHETKVIVHQSSDGEYI